MKRMFVAILRWHRAVREGNAPPAPCGPLASARLVDARNKVQGNGEWAPTLIRWHQ